MTEMMIINYELLEDDNDKNDNDDEDTDDDDQLQDIQVAEGEGLAG